MSSLAGWQGSFADDNDVLRRMAEVMSGPSPSITRHVAEDFAVATTAPAVAGDIERIACSEDGQATIAFSGYLYTEDRKEREHPARHCLELYRELGLTFATELNGTFGIVILDRPNGWLHLVSDRLGTRPLYYCQAEPFLFAGEVKAILEFPGVPRTLNADRLIEFLIRERVFAHDTYYDHIKRVPEASVLTWDGTIVRRRRYWEPPFDTEKCRDVRENARRVHEAIGNATRRSCAGASRPGMMLSGGLDSRAVATASAVAPLCLTMHTTAGHEVRTARRVAKALGYEHEFVPLPLSFPLELVRDGTLAGDGMNSFHHAQALYLADTAAAHGLDGILSGMFLEILLSDSKLPVRRWEGVGLKWNLPMLQPVERFDVTEAISSRLPTAGAQTVRELIVGPSEEDVLAQARKRITSWLSELHDGNANRYDLNDFAYLSNAPSVLAYLNVRAIDRIAPACIITWDADLVDLFFQIPAQHRFLHRLYSQLFTEIDRRCRWIPYSNTGAPVLRSAATEYLAGRLHRKVLRHVATGFGRLLRGRKGKPDWSAWPRIDKAMRERPEWRKYLRRTAESSRLVDIGVLSGDGLRRLVEEQINGRVRRGRLIGTWITLEEWLSQYG